MSRKVEIPVLTDDPWTSGAYDILKLFFFHKGQSRKSYSQIAKEAGLHPESFKQWKTGKTMPALDSVLRCFAALGYTLVVTPASESAFAHAGYFEMNYEFERQKAKANKEPVPLRPGSDEWLEANEINDDECLEPTAEDAEKEKLERSIPLAQRIKNREAVETRKAIERAEFLESKRRKKGKRGRAKPR